MIGNEKISRWIAEEGPRAVAYCRSIVHDHQAAEDVVQETFAALLRGRYDLTDNPKPLLYRSLTNRCFNYLRDNRRTNPTDFADDDSPGRPPSSPDYDDPARQAQRHELDEAIEAAFEKLPTRQRAALHLRVRMDMEHKDIARALGVSQQNAQVLVHRAREALKTMLGDYL